MERWQHLADLADFALAMKVTLNNLNKQSFNSFMLRIGEGAHKHTQPILEQVFIIKVKNSKVKVKVCLMKDCVCICVCV